MPENSQMTNSITEILDAIKQHEDQEKVIEIEEKKVQLVVILLAGEYYAFYGEFIKEILPVGNITYVPAMPDAILGVVNVRGDIESVLDLHKVLSLPETPITKRSRIMIGEVHQLRSGILVDSVEDVLEVPEDQISEPVSVLDSKRADYIIGESPYKNHALVILDLVKIFGYMLNY